MGNDYFITIKYEDQWIKGVFKTVEKVFYNTTLEDVEKYIEENKTTYDTIGMEHSRVPYIMVSYQIHKLSLVRGEEK